MSATESISVTTTKTKSFLAGGLAVMPLTIAVIPWGILAGSFALEVGLTAVESQAMSAIIFAGSAQLVALGMIKAGIGIGSILITTLLITSRHLLYAMAMRTHISPLPLKWRLGLGFLLTDELFAIANQAHHGDKPIQHLTRHCRRAVYRQFRRTWARLCHRRHIYRLSSTDSKKAVNISLRFSVAYVSSGVRSVRDPSRAVNCGNIGYGSRHGLR